LRQTAIGTRYPLAFCGSESPASGFPDHGGSHKLDNLIVCSRSGNLAKGIMTQQEFKKLLDAMVNMSSEARSDLIGRLKAGAVVGRLRFVGRKR
jgi:hypothetical protein